MQPPHLSEDAPLIGVAITTFRSAKIIAGCLDSLHAARSDLASVVITDNASSDDTCDVIRRWASEKGVDYSEAPLGEVPNRRSWLTLLRSPVNGGFAYGTNRGLELLRLNPAIGLFWVLNPDCIITPEAAACYRRAGRDQNFALMSGRTVFEEHRDRVQTDGGQVSRWTGVCRSVNAGKPIATAEFPDAALLDFLTGANCVASRIFLDRVGLMEENYFLYYEEVDWAFRRGDLALKVVPEALVRHIGGTSIGSGSVGRRPSPFANYFNYRNRIRFLRRFNPLGLPIAVAYALAKAVQLLLIGAPAEARALVAGLLGMKPPQDIMGMLSEEARPLAFGPRAA